jgi:nucleoside 2-deoxyribosyltransferase
MISKRSILATIAAASVAPLARGAVGHAHAQTSPPNAPEARAVKIYLASPLGFSDAGREFYKNTLKPMVEKAGYEIEDPWVLTPQTKIDAVKNMEYGPARLDAWRKLDAEIAADNLAGLDRSERVLAVLDGVDVDSGTGAEIGYAFAKRKPILGYRGDFRLSADNEGATVNLQVEYFITQSGGQIVTVLEKLPAALERLKSAKPKN